MEIRVTGEYGKKFPSKSSETLKQNVNKTEQFVVSDKAISNLFTSSKTPKAHQWEPMKKTNKEIKKADAVWETKTDSFKSLLTRIGKVKAH